MARKYLVNSALRTTNRILGFFIRVGIMPKNMRPLTVQGRKTGKLYSNPVSLVEQDGQCWLVAPYGEVEWVKNARASGQVTLTHGQQSEKVKLTEVGPEESAPILKTYLGKESITRPYFDVQPDSPLEAFAAEAPRHPVFRIERV